MDTIRLQASDTNGNALPVPVYDRAARVRVSVPASGSVVSPVLSRGLYKPFLSGAPVWMTETSDAVAAGPYDGQPFFPGEGEVIHVTPGKRLGFTAGVPNSPAGAAEVVLVPLAEA